MAALNYPDPNVTNPWVDPNGVTWFYDGDGWLAQGDSGSSDIYQDDMPDPADYEDGQGWMRTTDMVKFQLYTDVDSSQWVQVGAQVNASLLSGYKNVLINPNFRINQRSFDGDWAGMSGNNYGYDRWSNYFGTAIQQFIENANLVNGETYTLSWSGGGDGHLSIGDLQSGASPLTSVFDGASPAIPTVEVPITATNIQLELGSVQTAFEVRSIGLELSLCQRYFYRYYDNNQGWCYVNAGGARQWSTGAFPSQMRVSPSTSVKTAPVYSNASNAVAFGRSSSFAILCDVSALGQYYARGGEYWFDAEI